MLPPDDMTPCSTSAAAPLLVRLARPIGVWVRIMRRRYGSATTHGRGRAWSTDQLWVLVEGYDDLDQVRSRQSTTARSGVLRSDTACRVRGNLDEAHLLVNDIGD